MRALGAISGLDPRAGRYAATAAQPGTGIGDASAPGPILLFDDRCSVCRRFIALVVHADRGGALRLAPLRGMRGDAIRRRYPEHGAMSSALWVSGDGPPLSASDAILAVADYLGGRWGALARVGRLIPHGVRDWMYYTFAGNRSLFGWLGLPELDDSARRRMLSDDP